MRDDVRRVVARCGVVALGARGSGHRRARHADERGVRLERRARGRVVHVDVRALVVEAAAAARRRVVVVVVVCGVRVAQRRLGDEFDRRPLLGSRCV